MKTDRNYNYDGSGNLIKLLSKKDKDGIGRGRKIGQIIGGGKQDKRKEEFNLRYIGLHSEVAMTKIHKRMEVCHSLGV